MATIKQKRQRTKGFTFIEVLISLVIVGLVFGGYLNNIKSYLLEFSIIRQKFTAQIITWNQLIYTHANPSITVPSDPVETEMSQVTWFSEYETEKTLMEGLEKITVSTGMEDENISAQLSIYVYRFAYF